MRPASRSSLVRLPRFPSPSLHGKPLHHLDVVFNHMAGQESGTGVAGSGTFSSHARTLPLCLTAYLQVSPTTIILDSTNHKTSTTAVLLVTIFKTGTIPGKSRTVSSLTSPSSSLRKRLVHILKLTRTCHSLATGTDYVRGKLVDHANDLMGLGTDGLRIDAAKRTSHC